MESTWSSLPSQNLQGVFKYLENIELRPLTLVCKNWNLEADFYTRDKVWFRVDRLVFEEKFELLTESKRHFECIKIVNLPNDRLEDVLKVLMILTGRKLRFPNELVEVQIHYKDYNFLMPVLCQIGRSLKNLHLIASDDNWYYGRMKENDKFKKLSSVEVLRIDGFSNNIRHIASKFSSLKILILLTNTDSKSRRSETINIVDTFLKGNPNIEELHFNELYHAEFPDDLFKSTPKLKILKALTASCGNVIMKSKLNLEVLHIGLGNDLEPEIIRANYPNLKELKLETCSNIRPVWSMEHLRSLALCTIDLTNRPALYPKPILTTLELDKVRDEPFIISCIRNTPNVENCVVRGSFRVFQEIAKHWKQLRSFKYLWKRSATPFEFHSKLQFTCLESFSSNIDLCLSMESIVNFFENFQAPKLKTLNFNSDSFYLTKETKWNAILPYIARNYPKIENLTLISNLGFQIDDLSFVCREMMHLKSLVLEHSVPNDQESIPEALMLSKSLNSVQIDRLLNHKIEDKLKAMTDPPLRRGKTLTKRN